MKRSEQSGDISAALANAQMEMQNPTFDTTNPHFKSKFASLAAVRNAVVPILAKHGIAVTQELTSSENGVECLTVLSHSSGQFMEFGPLAVPVSKADAQGFGSASTYTKRYSLQAVCAVVGDDDDDGNAATAAKPTVAIPANIEGKTAFDAMPADEQQFLRDKAMELIALCESDQGDVVGFVEGLHLQSEEVLALWALLPSKTRTFYKKAKEADKASKPRSITAAEYAAQA